ncbi:MAG: T9SS type A sorting domain-containing protein, partial [Bacteroidales bacterium]|nr:T9SS type A sorting domain-containing protein [Bacteroidales bacterium]
KAQILQGRSIVSIREETESKLASFKQQKAKSFNALVRYYLNDTVNPLAAFDSLTVLLEYENSVSAKYLLAFLSGENGAWSEGLGGLNNIPVQFELTQAQILEHPQYVAQYNLLMELDQQGNTIFEADSAQVESLKSIEQTDAGQASAYARSILVALDELEYDEPILVPDILKSSAAMEEYEELLSKANEVPGDIKIQPNPAKDYIIAGYELDNKTGAVLEIHDINGNLKYRQNLWNQKDQLIVDTKDWRAGVYIAVLKINGELNESVKFTIID